MLSDILLQACLNVRGLSGPGILSASIPKVVSFIQTQSSSSVEKNGLVAQHHMISVAQLNHFLLMSTAVYLSGSVEVIL